MKILSTKILGSIRAKVWLCVLVAFLGFFLAAIASFRFTGIVSKNLTELQEIDFKVAMLASSALTSFKEQMKLYEDGFLTGEQEKVDNGNKLSGAICSQLHQMSSLIKRSRSLSPADLEKLHLNFKDYAEKAARLYQNPGGQETLQRQQDLQTLGQSRMKLLKEFEQLHSRVEADLEKIVNTTRDAASRTNVFIVFLFLFVFIILIIVVNAVANKLLIKPLLVVHEAVRQLARGELAFSLPADFSNTGEIGQLGIEMNKATGILKSLVQKVSSSSGELVKVTERIEDTSLAVDTAAGDQGKQLEKITIAVNKILESISNISHDVDILSKATVESSSTIQETAVSNSEVASNANHLFHAVEEVKTSITAMTASIGHVANFTFSLKTVTESATTSITEMDRSIKDIEFATAENASIALELRDDAELGKHSVDAVIAGMTEIKRSSLLTAESIASLSTKINNIRGIISTINDFMSQTNLLALNAAIIAAQAGKKGKSFAVVADEIRKLSISTAASADQIKSVIGGILAETEQTVAATKRALASIDEGEALTIKSGEALRKIVTGVEKSADKMGKIAQSTVEQAKESAVIKDGMTNVMTIVQKITGSMAEQLKGGQLILDATEQMYSQTAQVHKATMEQSKASKEIASSIESISRLISDIKFACDFQVKEGETIVTSLTDIKKSNRVNLDSTQTLNTIVAKLAAQVAVLQQEISFFSTSHPESVMDV